MTFKLIIDNGKPYEVIVNDDNELKVKLEEFKKMADSGDYAYFDIIILNEKDEDISESQFINELIGELS